MTALDEWDAAFRALVQRDDGTQIAALLRKAGSLAPIVSQAAAALQAAVAAGDQGAIAVALGQFNAVNSASQFAAYALAELFDPQFAFSPFVAPRRPPPDQIQMVNDGDGKNPRPRLKAAIECETAYSAAEVQRTRLVKEQAKKLGIRLEEDTDTTELELSTEEFAEQRGDQKALHAFANHRKARAKLSAAKAEINPAVRLTAKTLSKEHRARLERNHRIVSEMLANAQPLHASGPRSSANKAAQLLGERLGLSDRQVKSIWAAARKAMPYLEDLGKTLVK
jgi:hypothetical protein